MSHSAGVHFIFELFHGHPGANFSLKRAAPNRGVLTARHVDAVYALADSGQVERQGIHQKAGVYACPQSGFARFFGGFINTSGFFRVRQPGKREFFGGRNYVQPGVQNFSNLALKKVKAGAGGVKDHVGFCVSQSLGQSFGNLEARRLL